MVGLYKKGLQKEIMQLVQFQLDYINNYINNPLLQSAAGVEVAISGDRDQLASIGTGGLQSLVRQTGFLSTLLHQGSQHELSS